MHRNMNFSGRVYSTRSQKQKGNSYEPFSPTVATSKMSKTGRNFQRYVYVTMDEVISILKSPDALASAVSAATAEAISILFLFPLDSIKLKMQADSSVTAQGILKEVVENGNLQLIYKGIQGKLIQGPQQKMQYFYAYSILSQLYSRRTGVSKLSTSIALTLGYLSALQSLSVSLPLEEIIKKEGFLTFYQTFSASALICFNPAITYALFERLKCLILERKRESQYLTTMEAFVIGAVAKAFATIITFPAIRARVVQNTWPVQVNRAKKMGINLPETPAGFMETVNFIVKTEGNGGMFSGLAPAIIKGVSNAALMLALKEKIYETVNSILLRSKSLKSLA